MEVEDIIDNEPLKDKDPQEKNKLVASQKTAIDKLIDFVEAMAKADADLVSPIPFSLVNPEAFKALDQAIKAVLEKYEDYGRLFGEWGEKNPWYHNMLNIKAAKSFFGV